MTQKIEEASETEPLTVPSVPRWWRGLPALILMMTISSIDALILNDFVEYRYAELYQVNSTSSQLARDICLNATEASHYHGNSTPSVLSTTTSKYPISTTTSISDLVQSSTARLNIYISLAATIPSIITSIVLGANCDRIGRKSLIALPFIGKTLRYILLTAVAYRNLADWMIILSVMFDGMCGAASLCILSTFAYVSDCTTDKTRTPAIIITNVCILSSRVLPLLTFGFYLQSHHFILPMLITLGLSVAGFLFSIFLQPESNILARRLNIFQQLARVRLALVKNILQVYLVKREGNKQRRLLITVAIHLGFIVMICGHIAVFYLFLYGAPFCFNSLRVSLNVVAQTAATVMLTIPFTLTVAKRTDSLLIPTIGCLAYMSQFLLIGITHFVWVLYLAVCIGAIFFVTTPVIRSRISKLVEPSEYAVVFILASILESAGYYAISAASNEIYRLSFTFDSGLIFLVLAAVGLLPLSLMLWLFVIERRSLPVPKASTVNINE